MEKAYLFLEDGFYLTAVWHGNTDKVAVGEMVFNTSHSG
ncbi:MAG: carbamoyl phosphate synthase small subunit, partial [Bdellovibrionaceae bacterium]|nr:carbamoyl phosphate synthase small subunit [Pseudobdellovibrionaceae bacterium]